MSESVTIGLDLAGNVFDVHGADGLGQAALHMKPPRHHVLTFFIRPAPCVVAMETCCRAHFRGCEIDTLGHAVRLIASTCVKPFVTRQKNDTADAAAFCEATQRPTVRLVSAKSEKTRGAAMV